MLSNKKSFYRKRDTIHKWWDSPINSYSGLVKNTADKYITHGDFVKKIYNDINVILNENNYKLFNKNKFRNDLANLIYNISDDTSNVQK